MLYFGVGSISYWQRAYAFVDQNTRMDIDEHMFAIATKETEKSANVKNSWQIWLPQTYITSHY